MELLIAIGVFYAIFAVWDGIHKRGIAKGEEIGRSKTLAEAQALVKKSEEDRDRAIKDRQHALRSVEEVKNLWKQKSQGFPRLAAILDEHLQMYDKLYEGHLIFKKRPAYNAAEEVKLANAGKRKSAREASIYKKLLEYYEDQFPWIIEVRDLAEEEIENAVVETGLLDNEDPALKLSLLSKEEWLKLPTAERNQLALDRYWLRPKTPWQIGRLYELYVGHLYRQNGYTVEQYGIQQRENDLGRDLICQRSDETVIIQCKCWSKIKQIHEKHINQLYGTFAEYRFQLQEEKGVNLAKVRAHFVTSTELSERARKFAGTLGIEVNEKCKLEKFPCIKCNISPQTSEKIYHMPFDQMYDHTLIDRKGECYVSTVAEAEKLGFRRAKKWIPEKA